MTDFLIATFPFLGIITALLIPLTVAGVIDTIGMAADKDTYLDEMPLRIAGYYIAALYIFLATACIGITVWSLHHWIWGLVA